MKTRICNVVRTYWNGNTPGDTEGMLDLTGYKDVQIQIRSDGKVVWINVDGKCRLRINQIDGKVAVNDLRVK